MKGAFVALLLCLLLVMPGVSFGADDPPPPTDPFDALIVATSQLADLAVALKPVADAVEAKAEAVERKQAELVEAETAHSQAKADFNGALAAFLDAIDALKAAALEIPLANGGAPPAPPAAPSG